MRDKFSRAEHYRKKAEEARTIAEPMTDPQAKQFMLAVASDYEMLANMLERGGPGPDACE